MQKLDRNTLSIIGSFLELFDVSICCRLIRAAKYMFIGVVRAKITEDLDVVDLARCPNISNLTVGRSLSEDEFSWLSRLPIKRLRFLNRVSAIGDFSKFTKLEYLEADRVYATNHPSLTEIKYRAGECPVISSNIKRISGVVGNINQLLKIDPEQKFPFVCIVQDSRNQTYADLLSKYNLEHIVLYTDPAKFIKPCLKSLELYNCDIPDLYNTNIEQLTLHDISSISRYPRKLKILFANNSNIDMNALVETTIDDLSLNHCEITNTEMMRSLRLKKLTLYAQSNMMKFIPDSLVELRFTGIFDSEIEMKYIPASVTSLAMSCVSAACEVLPPNLTKLHCRDMKITSVGMQKIATLPLDSLTLNNCQITNQMLSLLAPLKLQHLNISQNGVTAKGIRSILHMPLRTLEHDKIPILKVL